MARWFKLDNAANIYPPVLNKTWAPMFRLSVDLTEDVDPEVLMKAQQNILKRFPAFATTLKKGFFWYYLDNIEGAAPVLEDTENPLQKINFRKNNGFMYRLLYYRNRIAVEFFHTLTDGTGGLTFLMSLTNEYLHLKYGTPVCKSKYILDCRDEPAEEELEDSFQRYGQKKTISISENASYQYKATGVPYDRLMIISATVDSAKLHEIAHRHNCSVGIYTVSLLLYSVLQLQKKDNRPLAKRKMVKVSLPVNLRRYFPSRTLRNFSSFVNPGLYGMMGDYDLDEVIEYCKAFLKINVNKKQLQAKFSYNVSAEKNFLIRITPLFLKVPVLQLSYYFLGDMNYCSTISNLGQVDLPEEVGKHVSRLDFMLGRPMIKRSMCGLISYNGKTVFNFTRTLVETDIEKTFLTTLVQEGLDVFVESNGRP